MYGVEYAPDCEHEDYPHGHPLEHAAALSARLHNGLIHGDPDHDCARVVEIEPDTRQREVLDA